MRALGRKLFRDLWHIKGQALAIVSVMACGVAIVVMTFGAMTSLTQTRDTYYEAHRFAHVFSQLKRAPLRIAGPISRWPGVAAVETRITHYAPIEVPAQARPSAVLLISLPESGRPILNRIALRQGRLPAKGRYEAVISENMAKALDLVPGSRIAVTMGGRRRVVTICGIALSPEFVYVLGPGQLVPDDKTFGILWTDRRLLEAAYDLDGAFNDVSILLTSGASEPDIIRRLDRLLAPYGGTAAYGRADQTSDAFIAQELDQLRTIAFVIPPIFLGVAAFLIHMVMSRLIETEREAIGLLKSFGYTNWEVGRHYLMFATLIAAVGIILGCAIGLWLGRWMTGMYQDYFRFPFLEYRLDRAVFVTASATSLAAALAGTWSAVMRAVRLAPATAMLPPAPPVYRRTMIERLHLGRFVSMPTQMIVRHIERWPLRAFFTSFGVAMAVTLLVGLFFFFDAIDEMVDSYYFFINRQDAVIGLLDQRSERARFEIARLPGVRAVEPVSEVPARLTHGHLSQRLSITGLQTGATFRAFRDADGRAFTLPRDGIVLSDKLANLLDLRAGGRVQVSILEGARRWAQLPVVAVAAEDIGLSAYMDRSALGYLTGQSGSITALQVLTDAAAQAALMDRLKTFPAVGSISTRAEAITSLRDMMARSMTIVIDFYIALGAIIAFGVIYNAARIALSERGRELASLRVLGFTQGEVTYILLGELALLVIAALPAGCVMGYGLAALLSQAMETKLFRVPFVVAHSTYGTAMAIALASAVASAAAVAWRINRLDLIAVLKTRE